MTQPTAETPVELCKSSDEYEASMIVAMLAEHDIQATMTGEFSAGFRAEAPGVVRVYVSPADLPLGKELLAAARKAAQPETSAEAPTVDVSPTPTATIASILIFVLVLTVVGMFLLGLF